MRSITLKKLFSFVLILITSGSYSYSQKIQYSRQNVLRPYADATEMVADIAGRHHILSFRTDEKPTVHVFDAKLQLIEKNELPFKFREGLSRRIIQFKEFYYLYVYQPGGSRDVWRINAHGDAVTLSETFKNLIDTTFKRNTVNVQLLNNQNELFITANTFFPEIGKVVTTVLHLDKDLKVVSNRKIVFPFKRYDGLRQITLVGDDAFILKTSNDSTGYSLQLFKINLNTDSLLMNQFSSSSAYSYASFKHTVPDSGIAIYAVIKNVVFVTKLDRMLNEKAPVTLLRNQFQNVTTSYVFLPGAVQQSAGLSYGSQSVPVRSIADVHRRVSTPGTNVTGSVLQGFNETSLQYSERMQQPYPAFFNSYGTRSNPRIYNPVYDGSESSVRFSILNDDFKLARDSILKNGKHMPTVNFTTAANVVMDGKNYILFKQKFTGNREGLLAVYKDDQNRITSKDIRVFDKYDYLLSLLQSVNDEYIILPYTHKREVGLVKIAME